MAPWTVLPARIDLLTASAWTREDQEGWSPGLGELVTAWIEGVGTGQSVTAAVVQPRVPEGLTEQDTAVVLVLGVTIQVAAKATAIDPVTTHLIILTLPALAAGGEEALSTLAVDGKFCIQGMCIFSVSAITNI